MQDVYREREIKRKYSYEISKQIPASGPRGFSRPSVEAPRRGRDVARPGRQRRHLALALLVLPYASTQNFGKAVLGCIEPDFCKRIITQIDKK